MAPLRPNRALYPSLAPSPWLTFHLDLTRSLWALLPAATLWGASFPLALASVAARGQDPGRLVGEVYAANTVGAIVGALAGSLILVGSMGTQGAQRLVIGVAIVSAMLMFVPMMVSRRSVPASATNADRAEPAIGFGWAMAVIAAVFIAVLLLRGVPKVPPGSRVWALPAGRDQSPTSYISDG